MKVPFTLAVAGLFAGAGWYGAGTCLGIGLLADGYSLVNHIRGRIKGEIGPGLPLVGLLFYTFAILVAPIPWTQLLGLPGGSIPLDILILLAIHILCQWSMVQAIRQNLR